MYFDDESNTKYAVFRILSREVMDNNIFSFYKKKKKKSFPFSGALIEIRLRISLTVL